MTVMIAGREKDGSGHAPGCRTSAGLTVRLLRSPLAHGRTEPCRDADGVALFSKGPLGRAHVEAHEMWDTEQFEEGYLRLRKRLAGLSGSGSAWIHLQFHLAVFELRLGRRHAAFARFLSEILPAAGTTMDALTDGPALLWRIGLAASRPLGLPWQPLRRTALISLRWRNPPFVDMHNLLALAGAGDLEALDRRRGARTGIHPRPPAERLVQNTAAALHACLTGGTDQAAALFRQIVSQLPEFGGSRAQNALFLQLADVCTEQAGISHEPPKHVA